MIHMDTVQNFKISLMYSLTTKVSIMYEFF
jgi:hypothetical protein